MKALNLKPTHKAIKTYYEELQQLSLLDASKESAVAPAFANLLRHCARQFNWTLYEQYPLKHGTRNIYPDGALVDTFNLPYGYWEAKDNQDDLEQEIRKKFDKDYLKDKKQIVYNHFLMLDGIPPEAFEYRLGNKSALHWIIDQYCVKTDKRSGIVNNPNRADEPDYIVNLIQRVITVSVETVKIVKGLPELEEAKAEET